MALSLEDAIARVPQWAGVTNLKATPLSGGITNSNYRIDVDGESFVLRIVGADTELLGIDREYEYTANLTAGKLGIAPEVVYFIRPEGCLVTRFIPGRPILPDEMRKPETIRQVVDILHKIHAMPDIPGNFHVFSIIAAYCETARRYRVPFPKGFDRLEQGLHAAELVMQSRQLSLLPCHNDLLNANFLYDGHITILDWEYAGMGDIFFDLANFSDHHELTDEQDRWLLQCYFGQVRPPDWAHLKIMKVLSDLRETTWALVQIGISKLDFDFRSYADRFFKRAMDKIQNPDWNQWLTEVQKNV
ncbi:MAG TPA: choline/ethanolamine kinase family protein [Anaerolineales bacterium]|nr:choline/ethanolamine kinase family protein [Anaerolineales bacterium]